MVSTAMAKTAFEDLKKQTTTTRQHDRRKAQMRNTKGHECLNGRCRCNANLDFEVLHSIESPGQEPNRRDL